MNRILIINPHGIGDVLFTTPVVSNLRRAYPDAHISYIGNRRTEGLLKANAKIDQVLSYERDEFYAVYKKSPVGFLKKWADLVRTIKKGRFDVVFDFSLNNAFGFVSLIAGIPRRLGFDYRGRGRFLTDKFPLKGYEGRHVIEYYLDLLAEIGVPVSVKATELPISVMDEEWAGRWVKSHKLDNKQPMIAVVPGGGASWGTEAKNKRWPAVKYAQLVDKIIADSNAAVILMGDIKEEGLCKEVEGSTRHSLYSAVGQTTVTQMAALFRKCRCVIVNDGGPLHVAVASGLKTVSIFGPVDQVVYGPYLPAEALAKAGPIHQVVTKGLACQPCYRRFRMARCSHLSCLQDLSVEDVFRKVKHIL